MHTPCKFLILRHFYRTPLQRLMLCHFSWFVIGQLCGSVALNRLNAKDPYDFRTAIYTQVREVIHIKEDKELARKTADHHKWAMIGCMLIIFLLIPESPWWLAGKGKLQSAEKVLLRYHGHIEGYNVQEQIVSPSNV